MITTAQTRTLRNMGLLDAVVSAAARRGVSLDDVFGARRSASVVYVRREVAVMLRERGLSLSEIGDILNKDHSSVIYMLAKAAPRTSTPSQESPAPLALVRAR